MTQHESLFKHLSKSTIQNMRIITQNCRYLALYDTNRQELLSVYDQNARFSMTVGPSQSYAERQSMESKEDLQNMTNMSRNLNVVSDAKSRQELLQTGSINIIHHLMKMPQTKHNFAELFVDTHMLNVPVFGQAKAYIVVTCHGAYDVPGFKRSFDRVFILDAATPEYAFFIVITQE